MKSIFTKQAVAFFLCIIAGCLSCQSQTNNARYLPGRTNHGEMAKAADQFLQTLSESQKSEALFSYDDSQRYDWHYIPRERKGLPLKSMSAVQQKAAFALLRLALSDTGYKKATSIIQLELVLREVEGRPADDTYRDPANYSFSIFGDPATSSVWGWRLEGHHISLNFSSENDTLISVTPGFFGSNPAMVLSGPEKGKYILKDETEMGLALLQSLQPQQIEKAVISERAPGDIVTTSRRKAMINDQKGILYSELNNEQKKLFLSLLSLYIHRYTRQFADDMMKDIEEAGMDKLLFAWAGDKQTGVGHPHYYRIQGPTIIIEYDNTQNNANHIHTVIRDLKYDFGGDELLEHYKKDHQH